MSDQPALGQCLCGAVRFAVVGPLRDIVFCHCGQCRRQQGAFAACTAAARADLTVFDDASLQWYASSPRARRGFCRRCGSSLFWEGRGRPERAIAVAALGPAVTLGTRCHIHTAGRRAHELPHDGLPRHAHGLGIATDEC